MVVGSSPTGSTNTQKDIMKLAFNTTKFIEENETMHQISNTEYIDAIVEWCAENKVEVEYAASFIRKDPVFKSKILIEAENLNYVKKNAKLPF